MVAEAVAIRTVLRHPAHSRRMQRVVEFRQPFAAPAVDGVVPPDCPLHHRQPVNGLAIYYRPKAFHMIHDIYSLVGKTPRL